MSENASVTGCNSIAGGGVSARGNATESDPPVFTMEGSSSITDCTALNGGGIFVSMRGGKVSLSGSAKIENCRAVEKVKLEFPEVTGGGVHVSSGSFEMSGGSIESCTAVNTLAIVSQHGTATAKFTVKAKPAETATPQPTVTPQPTAQPQPTVQPVSPRTGDTANPALWFALLIVSGGAAIGITVASRKKKHNK